MLPFVVKFCVDTKINMEPKDNHRFFNGLAYKKEKQMAVRLQSQDSSHGVNGQHEPPTAMMEGSEYTRLLRSKLSSNGTLVTSPAVKHGGQGRVKDPARDRRLAGNRNGPTGQGQVLDPEHDRRLAQNRRGPTGQGRVKDPQNDRRLSENRDGPTGQGRVKDPEHDRRLSGNRQGPTGQGRVKNPLQDRRLRDNRRP
jgi:hypothetical protein